VHALHAPAAFAALAAPLKYLTMHISIALGIEFQVRIVASDVHEVSGIPPME
jgi:hypothetical protein